MSILSQSYYHPDDMPTAIDWIVEDNGITHMAGYDTSGEQGYPQSYVGWTYAGVASYAAAWVLLDGDQRTIASGYLYYGIEAAVLEALTDSGVEIEPDESRAASAQLELEQLAPEAADAYRACGEQ